MHLPGTVRPLSPQLSRLLSLVGVPVGLLGGFLVVVNPLYFAALLIAIVVTVCFFISFEKTVIALLVFRSALDIFSGLPAAFAVGLDALILAHITILLLTKQKIYIDKFWLIFAAWGLVQGLWPVLTALGGLGLGREYLGDSIREWVRIFSWVLVYLAINQFKGRIHPEQVIAALFWALVIPLSVATLQLIFPPYVLPTFLQAASDSVFESGSRINSTLGHPNTFVSFLILFIGLTYWKIRRGNNPRAWGALLLVEVFFLVSTKALVGFPMLFVLFFIMVAPQFSIKSLFGALFVFSLLIALFASTEFGRERFAKVLDTPLLNPNLTVNRAILLSWFDTNSFNWRLAQWTFLIEEWKQRPLLGYGLGLASYLGPIRAYAHNDYVRVLVEGGIVGTVLFCIFHILQLFYLGRLYFSSVEASKKQFCLCLVAIFCSFMVGMITENIWTHTAFFFYWWTLFSMASWDWSKDDSASTSARS